MIPIISWNRIKGPELTQQLERDAEQRLNEHGVRLTRGRRQVLDAVATAGGPRTATEIHGALDSLPLSSLYRSLGVLTDTGVLAQHHGADETTRYELSESLSEHHHHLVCVNCGSISDVAASDVQEATVHELAEELAASAGFAVTGHRLEIEGRCERCR